MKTKFNTLAQFKSVYTGHFFDRASMKFFNSRIESKLIKGRYFITSESYSSDGVRTYQVREINTIQEGVNAGTLTINTLAEDLKSLSAAKSKLNGLSIVQHIIGE